MKKKLVLWGLKALLVLGVLGAIAYGIYTTQTQGQPGHVLIGYGPWSIETSLFLFLLALLVAFVAFHLSLRLIFGVKKLPQHLKQKKTAQSQQALVDALVDSAEGNWKKAEQNLIRHATNSSAPLIHYLTAARTADSRGARKKRDQYLKQAYRSSPNSEIAVRLTQAELQLSNRQFDQAVENLTRLQSLAPGHATVLKLLHKAYTQLNNWEAIQKLLPDLHKNKALKEAEIKLLETETYSALLKQQAEAGNIAALKAHWQATPGHIKTMQGVHSIYSAAMIEAGAGEEILPDIRAKLEQEWDQSALVLYGAVKSSQPEQQLAEAEKWLPKHSSDPILLRVLGRLSIRTQQLDSAAQYLGDSLKLEPSVDAYLLLGDMLKQKTEHEKASECYRRGMLLASDEVVKHIEDIPV